MTADFFVDTNVLVYAVDRTEGIRRARAKKLLEAVIASGRGSCSPQVIGEFVRVSTCRLDRRLSAEQASDLCDWLLRGLTLIPIDERVTREALRCWRRHSISYWDAQVWATARVAGLEVILTEDIVAPELEGIRYVDPLADGFDSEQLR